MKKVLLIIQREYLTRVRKKAFIVMTLLVPTLIVVMYGIIAFLAVNNDELNKAHVVKIIDERGDYAGKFHNVENLKFQVIHEPVATAKAEVKKEDDSYLLWIPAKINKTDTVQFFSKKKPSLTITGEVENQINAITTNNGIVKMGIDPVKLNAIKSNHITVGAREITDNGDTDANVGAAYGAGIAGAILIYISLFIYGAQVMRGVIEEKTSRIVEVIISSVKPFQLMLGKIIGVGMVGLTQFLLWIILSTSVSYIAGHFFSVPASPVMGFVKNLGANAYVEIGYFMFYWVTGYLLYSALFAAVGSAVDSETETQQFMFPITLPLLFTYILSVSYLFQVPDSPLAVWLSIIPFTAPIAMMVRLPFGVPDWQMELSMAMMVIGFLFTTYIAARIYRVGILMYGKKASYKELVKWFFYKE
jgi:ABC-2 type transport system permease protein